MRRLTALVAVLAAAGLAAPAFAGTTHWTFDPVHTEVNFEVPYMMFSSVDGKFLKFKGTVTLDDGDVTKSKVDVTIDPASITTGNKMRDRHLRGDEFFDAKKFPKITFVSSKVTKGADGKLEVQGTLTMHGVSKVLTLEVKGPSPALTDPSGRTIRAAKGTVTLNRHDFKIDWNKTLDKGGTVVGNKVAVTIKAVLVKQ